MFYFAISISIMPVCLQAYLKNQMLKFHQIFDAHCLRIDPPLTALPFVMCFWFWEWC